MELKIDFHVHTTASKDGVASIEDVIAMAKMKGLDGVAITDHDVPMTVERSRWLSNDSNFIVLPGVEISTKSGHIILLFPQGEMPKRPSVNEVLDLADGLGAPVIIPHPTDPLSQGVGERTVRSILRSNPALEVFNASTFFLYNRHAKKLANEFGLCEVAGSDAHVASAVGCAYTIVEAEDRTISEIVEAVWARKTRICGSYTPVTSLLELTLRRVRRKLGTLFDTPLS
ncbi:MAG: PHP-associated domain-containing protein [Candidatus Methanomethylicaceae archaeon]